METKFTQKMQELRANLDATIDARNAFMKGLRENVHGMRADVRAFVEQLQQEHREASARMQAGLGEAQSRRRQMRDDLRGAAAALRHRQH